MSAWHGVGAEEDFRALAETIPQMVWATRADGYHEFFNGRWYEYTGLSPEQSFAEGWSLVLHPDDYARALEVWARSLRTGAPYDTEHRFRRHDGVYHWFFASARPVRAPSGAIVRWFGTCTDIHDRVSAENTLQFLLDAGKMLGASLDPERTLESLARLAVPRLAESAAVYMPEADGSLGMRVIAHQDPAKLELARDLVRRFPATSSTEGIVTVMRTGESVLVPHMPPEALAAVARDEEHAAALREIGISSVITVPLRAGGATIGVLQLVNSTPGRIASEAERRVAESLAARASIALDNARLFARERQIAAAFQSAALPVSLPDVPGLALDAVYEPGSSESLVGGDWYDALRLRDGRLVVSVGDVAGSGLEAAVIMSGMRQAVRTVAHVYADPVMILDAADRTLKNEHPEQVVTAFVGVFDPVTHELTYALAGHPPPLVRRAGGALDVLSIPELPLGLRTRADADDSRTVRLEPGDLLVLYTDGVTEATHDVLEGERRLHAAVAAVDPAGPHPARAIAAEVLPEHASDDVAILTLHVGAPAEGRTAWRFASGDAVAAQAARSGFVRRLAALGFTPAQAYGAELVFGELLGNVVRHAGGPVEITFEEAGEPVLHVLDRGAGFSVTPHLPTDLLAERGRGLYLVWRLTEDFNVTKRPGGGSHARAVLAPR